MNELQNLFCQSRKWTKIYYYEMESSVGESWKREFWDQQQTFIDSVGKFFVRNQTTFLLR